MRGSWFGNQSLARFESGMRLSVYEVGVCLHSMDAKISISIILYLEAGTRLFVLFLHIFQFKTGSLLESTSSYTPRQIRTVIMLSGRLLKWGQVPRRVVNRDRLLGHVNS